MGAAEENGKADNVEMDEFDDIDGGGKWWILCML